MDTRARLIGVAAKLFAEGGFDGVSVRDIVNAAGVNLGAITYHFGGKEELFDAVVQDKVKPLMAMTAKLAESKLSPREKLSRVLESFAMHILHDDPALRFLFTENVRKARHLPPRAVKLLKQRNRMVEDIIREGVADGSFRQCNVEHTVWLFFGVVAPYVVHQAAMKDKCRNGAYSKPFVEEVVGNALGVFFSGIEKKAAEQSRSKKSS